MVNLANYSYLLPNELIAQRPTRPRDRSRLFIYNTVTDSIQFDYFLNLDRYLPSQSLLVLNNTKVLPARIIMYKANGGRVTVLFLVNETSELWSSALVDRQVRVGEKLFFNKDRYLTVIGQKEKVFYFNLDFDRALFLKILNRFGRMPIPPYIKNTPLKEPQLRKSYQTIFASQIGPACRQAGSSAAPTAALHFTKRVFNKLERKGVKRAYITLNIGMGTFAPINENNIKTKRLHEEYYQVDETAVKKIAKANNEGNKIVAVGTTVVRTLESAAKPGMDKTDIFIMPPYRFRVVDVMITNFHLPRSSLMMLVEAFLQSKRSKKSLVDLYKIAINEKLRFYSFGDAMLIL